MFVSDSTFKTPMPDNLVNPGDYVQFTKSKMQPILSDSEIMAIYSKIESDRLKPSIKTHREHIKHVKTIVEEKQHQIDDNSCPKCGKPMVMRTARSGANQGKQFLGCSGFPKCRAMRQVS